MIKEGCLVDYVMSWGDNLPTVNLKERIIEINKGLGCGLSEAFKIYQAEQTSQERSWKSEIRLHWLIVRVIGNYI